MSFSSSVIWFHDAIGDLCSLHLFTTPSSGWLTFYPEPLPISCLSAFTSLLDCIQDRKKGYTSLSMSFHQGVQSFTKASLPPAVFPLHLIGQNWVTCPPSNQSLVEVDRILLGGIDNHCSSLGAEIGFTSLSMLPPTTNQGSAV